MPERSAFFDSQNDDRPYASADFARVLGSLAGRDGVVAGAGDELAVEPTSPASMAVQVGTGSVWIQGRHYNLYGQPMVLEIPDADTSHDRIDRVVVRMDTGLAARTIEVYVKVGTPGEDPDPPSLERNSDAWEISLAQVYVAANATEIEAENITDERSNEDVCGYVQTMAGAAADGAAIDVVATPGRSRQFGFSRNLVALPPFRRVGNNPIFASAHVAPQGPQHLTILYAAGVLPNPVDNFYMYVSPHDPPGGVWLATAPAPEGPWTLYDADPIFELADSAWAKNHISSPDVLWTGEKLLLYWHAPEDDVGYPQSTGVSESIDGINWSEAVSAPVLRAGATRTSLNMLYRWDGTSFTYARVMRWGSGYIALAQCNGLLEGAMTGVVNTSIGVAYSDDGLLWWQSSRPILRNSNNRWRPQVPTILPWNTGILMLYVDSDNAGIGPVEAAFTPDLRVWHRLGTVLDIGTAPWEEGGIVGPYLFPWGNKLYLYYGGFDAGLTTACLGLAVADMREWSV